MDLNSVWGAKDLIMAGLVYTIMGILVVFLILIIIMCAIKAMALLSGAKEVKPEKIAQSVSTPESTPVVEKQDDGELVAVITAAIVAMMGQSASSFRIKSYKRVRGNEWSKAGRQQSLENRF